MEVSTKKIHTKNNKSNDGKRFLHTHTKGIKARASMRAKGIKDGQDGFGFLL
jgi:hypothetical protein